MADQKSQSELLNEIAKLTREFAERFNTTDPVSTVQQVCNEVWLANNNSLRTYDLNGDDPYDSSVFELMEGVDYLCKCSSSEYTMLWDKWCDQSLSAKNLETSAPKHPRMTWEEERRSYHGPTIGEILSRPVMLSFRRAIVNGLLVLFYDCTSQVQDYKMVENWFKKYMADVKKTDAGNFHHIYHESVRRKTQV